MNRESGNRQNRPDRIDFTFFGRLPAMLRLRFRSLFRGSQADRELDEELHFHLDRQIEADVARGVPADQARTAALRAIGGLEQRKEQMRDQRGVSRLENLVRDVRLAGRQLGKQPGFTLAAVLSLALGIGANTAIFQLLNALILQTLPVAAPHELVEVRLTGDGRAGRHTGRNRQMSLPQFEELQRRQQVFASMLAFGDTRFNLSPQGEVQYVEGLWVSGSFFQTLGVPPAAGRLFSPDDDRPGCGASGAVISHALWQREFGGRSDLANLTIPFGSRRVPVVGVTPPGFFGVEVGRQFGVAMPICAAEFTRRDHWWLAVIGRVKPGGSLERARAHVETLLPDVLRETTPAYDRAGESAYLSMRADVVDASAGVSPLRRSYARSLWILMAIAGLVLLIASVNLANLLLARATARAQEFAVRLALGGTRGRVLQQVFTESVLLAAVGSVAALGVASAAGRSIPPLISTATDPVHLDLGIDWRIFAFTALVGIGTSMIFGMAPALRAARAPHLRTGQRGAASHEGLRMRRALVSLQVAVTLVLLFGGLLFLRSFRNLATEDTGVSSDGVVIANVFYPAATFPLEKRRLAYAETERRLAALPGVARVAEAFTTPIGGNFSDRDIAVDGRTLGNSYMNPVSAGYFDVLGTPLAAGRDFDAGDVPGAPAAAIVNEAFAARFLDGRALGRRFSTTTVVGTIETTYDVIGVVSNQKYLQMREPFPPIFYPASSQIAAPGLTQRYVLRSLQPPARTIAEVGAALREIDPAISVRSATLERQIGEAMLQERLMARLSALFGGLALLLAAIGLYGLVAYTVASRRGEIAVRIALGAGRGRVLGMIIGEVAKMLGAGIAAGSMLALALAGSVRSLLYGLDANDPATLLLAGAVLLLAGLLAAGVPALRAARVDPAGTLREA
jgi:predicted permease